MSDTTDDAALDADFAGGFEGKTTEKTTAKEKPAPAATPRAEEPPAPEYVQITKTEHAEMKAAAARVSSYDQQFAKAFGTIGNMQKTINELRAQTPRDLDVKMPDQAFTKMAKDFPELAELSREEFKAALSNLKAAGNAEPDEEVVTQAVIKLEGKDLEEEYPDWKNIVGAVPDIKDADPNNPFRKWLATKDQSYQDRVNSTPRPRTIERAIRRFQNETRSKPAVTPPRNDARAARIAAAVQPRGDGAGTGTGGKSDDDMFMEGFNSR
jgi:hypothetical protein